MHKIIFGLIVIAALPSVAVAEPYPDGAVPCLKGSCSDSSSAPRRSGPDWQQVRTSAKALGAGRVHCSLCDQPYRVTPIGK
jgi:hypothetical protein